MISSRFLCCGLIAYLLLAICSCSKSDEPETGGDDPNVTPDPPTETVDYTAFRQFVATSIEECNYITSINVASGEIRVKTLSQGSASVSKSDIPYLTVGGDGNWSVDGKSTTVSANYPEVGRVIPKVTVDANGNLVINGSNVGIQAGKTLRCVINARKHVYFCFSNATYALGSETYGTYNPVLPESVEQLNVLFIGNSFTVDATEHLPGMLTSAGVKNVNMIRLYHGGYTLPEYQANFNSANVCARYDAGPGATSWSGNGTLDDKPADALKAREWDVVVIQEHTGRSEAWSWPGVLKPAVESLVDIIHAAQPKHRPTIIYLMSQTYSTNSTVLATNFSNDRSKMFATTSDVVKKLMGETCVDMVISTGCTLENLRTTSVNVKNGMELTRDSYHMDYGISRYAAACAVFETIITPCTGKKLSDITYRKSESNTTNGNYRTPITDTNAPVAQRAAHEAVEKPFEVTNLSNL